MSLEVDFDLNEPIPSNPPPLAVEYNEDELGLDGMHQDAGTFEPSQVSVTSFSMTNSMNEAQARIAKANYYGTFTTGDLIAGADSDPIAREVEEEFRTFAVNRMEVLLGMRAEDQFPKSQQFSPEEIIFLKQLCASASEVTKPRAPKKVEPRIVPRTKPVATPVRPTVPQQQARPQSAPVAAPKAAAKPASGVPADGDIVERNGKRLRVNWRKVGPNHFQPLEWQKVMAIQNGTAKTFPGLGTLYRKDQEVHRILTSEVPTDNPNRPKTPVGPQFTEMSMQVAQRDMAAMNPGMAALVGGIGRTMGGFSNTPDATSQLVGDDGGMGDRI